MTTKTTGVIAAGLLAIGILVGAAGTIVARDDAANDMADHMPGMTSMMGAGTMNGMGSMMSMMGGDSPMTPDDHESHHASPSPAATR